MGNTTSPNDLQGSSRRILSPRHFWHHLFDVNSQTKVWNAAVWLHSGYDWLPSLGIDPVFKQWALEVWHTRWGLWESLLWLHRFSILANCLKPLRPILVVQL